MNDEELFVERSLADLEAERAAGDLDERDYVALKAKYEARAARDAGAMEAPPRRRVAWPVVAAILAVALIAGVLVARVSGQRLPGQASSGSIDAASTDQLSLARQYLADGKAVDALKIYDKILKANPKQVEALAYRGWLVRLAGLGDEGLAYIDRAIAADPAYPDAHFFKAMILWKDKHQPAAAVPEFQAVLADRPPADLVADVKTALQQAQAEAAAPTTTTTP